MLSPAGQHVGNEQRGEKPQGGTMRWCADIGMFAIDRPIDRTCHWKTKYCTNRCYNVAIEKRFGQAIVDKDARNEAEWSVISGPAVARELARKREYPTDRVRFMTRGEALANFADFPRVEDIVSSCPDTDWWMPTRAWRMPVLMREIEARLWDIPNLVVLASLDPDNSEAEYRELVRRGWSTMYFGPDPAWQGFEKAFRCPKTWRKLKGHCGICKAGCFAPITLNRRVDVWLKEH